MTPNNPTANRFEAALEAKNSRPRRKPIIKHLGRSFISLMVESAKKKLIVFLWSIRAKDFFSKLMKRQKKSRRS
jgi:hypothetical protein